MDGKSIKEVLYRFEVIRFEWIKTEIDALKENHARQLESLLDEMDSHGNCVLDHVIKTFTSKNEKETGRLLWHFEEVRHEWFSAKSKVVKKLCLDKLQELAKMMKAYPDRILNKIIKEKVKEMKRETSNYDE